MIKRAIYLLLLLLALSGAFLAYQRFQADAQGISTSTPVGDVPVVFRTNGGLLEVATLRHKLQFKRTEKGTLFGLEVPGCPTVATVAVQASFVYRVKLAPEWKAKITADRRVLVVAPPIEPSLPVAFDTATLDESLNGCMIIKDKALLGRLRKQISANLATRAKEPAYRAQVRDKAAKTVQEFIRKWYLSREEYAYAKDYEITVRFKGEPIEDLM